MEVEDEAESRRKLDEQKEKLQKELRDVDRLSCVSKEMQESVRGSLQHQLQEVEKRRHVISCLSTRRRKSSRKRYKASRTKEDICRRTVSQQKRRCGSSKIRSGKRRSVTFSYQTKSIRIRCRMQTWWQSFRVCRREKKEEAVMLRRQVIAAWRPGSEWMSRREEERRNSEDEQEQGRINQQLVLPTPGGINQGATASSLELDLSRYLVKAKVQEDQAHKGIATALHG